MSADDRTFNICISRTIAADHTARGVFPTLSPENALRKDYANGGFLIAIDRKMAMDIADDSARWLATRIRGRETAGRTISHGALLKDVLRGLDRVWDIQVKTGFYETSAQVEAQRPVVEEILIGLGIPAAKLEMRSWR